MQINETASKAALELAKALETIDEDKIESLLQAILHARKIYVAGAGRSLLMLRGFAMRLMHLGFETYVTGDTTTPAFEAGDLMIIASGSGETSNLVSIANRVIKYGGNLAVITINPNSTLGELANVKVLISAFTDKYDAPTFVRPILPGGSMFEEAVLILCDTLVIPLANKLGVSTSEAFPRHANLE